MDVILNQFMIATIEGFDKDENFESQISEGKGGE